MGCANPFKGADNHKCQKKEVAFLNILCKNLLSCLDLEKVCKQTCVLTVFVRFWKSFSKRRAGILARCAAGRESLVAGRLCLFRRRWNGK